MERNNIFTFTLICLPVVGVGGQAPSSAPTNSLATPVATPPATTPAATPKPKSPSPVATPESSPTPASAPPKLAAVTATFSFTSLLDRSFRLCASHFSAVDLLPNSRSSIQVTCLCLTARENSTTHFHNPPHKILVEILPSDSSKWASLFVNSDGGGPDNAGSGLDGEKVRSEGHKGAKKKKKRAKKKKASHLEEEEEDESEDLCCQGNSSPVLGYRAKEELVSRRSTEKVKQHLASFQEVYCLSHSLRLSEKIEPASEICEVPV
ncbi:hypothetical protein ACFX2J_000689 [Malus domestica]